jgi:hypothetical protein
MRPAIVLKGQQKSTESFDRKFPSPLKPSSPASVKPTNPPAASLLPISLHTSSVLIEQKSRDGSLDIHPGPASDGLRRVGRIFRPRDRCDCPLRRPRVELNCGALLPFASYAVHWCAWKAICEVPRFVLLSARSLCKDSDDGDIEQS